MSVRVRIPKDGEKRTESVPAAPKFSLSPSATSPVRRHLYLQKVVGNRALQNLAFSRESRVNSQAEGTEIRRKGALDRCDVIQRGPDDEKEPQIFGRPPPKAGDYVPDRPTVPHKKPEHKLITSGSKNYTYDEWLTSQLGRELTADERKSFNRGCVGLMLLRLGYPGKQWPWEIPGNECWLTESKALKRQKEMKTDCNGFPPAMYAFQSDGGWKPGKEPNEKQKRGEAPVNPEDVEMKFMPDPDYNLWNFATRHKNLWEWMNFGKSFSSANKPWRVRVREDLPTSMGSDKPVITLYGLVCPKAPKGGAGNGTPQPQPQPTDKKE